MSYDEEKAGLLKKVRELEAELDRERLNRRAVELANARAETAERLLEEWKNEDYSIIRLKEHLARAEAFIAELEHECDFSEKHHEITHGDCHWAYTSREREKVP